MASRNVRSVTFYDDEPVPSWARFTVLVCTLSTAIRTPTQAFSSRAAAERWARAIAKVLCPAVTNDGPLWWVLVRALDPVERPGWYRRTDRGHHCYLAFDGGGHCVKNHPILSGYGRIAKGAAS